MTMVSLRRDCKYVIYGADAYGEIALAGLRVCGLDAEYFLDRKLAGKELMGVSIRHPMKESFHPEYCYIVAAGGAYKEVCSILRENHCHQVMNLIPFLDLDLPIESFSSQAKEFWLNKHLYYGLIHQPSEGELYIPHVDFCTTDFCSLKCKHCSQLIPYFPEPQNIDLDYSLSCFDRFLSAVDYIVEVRVLGGEPFCNIETYKVIEHLYQHPKIGQTVIYTNGTIVPSRQVLEDLNDGMAVVHISDYGVNKKSIEKLIKVFSSYNGIRYFVRNYDAWMNLGDSSLRNITESQIEMNYESCNQRTCKHFHNDKFYSCPRVASLYHMKICGQDTEWVDFSEDDKTVEVYRRMVKALLDRKIPYEACRRCNGSLYAQTIPAAEQI